MSAVNMTQVNTEIWTRHPVLSMLSCLAIAAVLSILLSLCLTSFFGMGPLSAMASVIVAAACTTTAVLSWSRWLLA